MDMSDQSLKDLLSVEINDLHEFFVEWFTGTSPEDDDYFSRSFTYRFSENFLLVPPDGSIVSLDQISNSIRSRHGSNPEFRIAIRRVIVRKRWGNLILATYEEWQRNALASEPAENGRLASVLFEFDRTLTWQHIHETWLPQEVIKAGPYDF